MAVFDKLFTPKKKPPPEASRAGKPVPVARDPGDTRKQDLWDYVQKFVREQQIECAETAYQVDHVMANAPGFIAGCADIVGFHKED